MSSSSGCEPFSRRPIDSIQILVQKWQHGAKDGFRLLFHLRSHRNGGARDRQVCLNAEQQQPWHSKQPFPLKISLRCFTDRVFERIVGRHRSERALHVTRMIRTHASRNHDVRSRTWPALHPGYDSCRPCRSRRMAWDRNGPSAAGSRTCAGGCHRSWRPSSHHRAWSSRPCRLSSNRPFRHSLNNRPSARHRSSRCGPARPRPISCLRRQTP